MVGLAVQGLRLEQLPVPAARLRDGQRLVAAVEMAVRRHDPPALRQDPVPPLRVGGPRPATARDVEDGVALAGHHPEPVGLDRSQAAGGIDRDRVLDVGGVHLEPVVHQHPVDAPAVVPPHPVAVAGGKREGGVLLPGPVEALAGLALAVDLVADLAPEAALVHEGHVVEHHLLDRDRAPGAVHDPRVHARDEAVDLGRLGLVRLPLDLVAADADGLRAQLEGPDLARGGGGKGERGGSSRRAAQDQSLRSAHES
jgi:hypothetical protein